MDEISTQQRGVELLLGLGLKEYEAKCFVVLSRLPWGTARDISEHSDVPRTRVYDAIRVLESKGLVEIQNSSPQKFRAVPIDEAIQTLRSDYERRTASLRDTLHDLDPITQDDVEEYSNEVWTLSSGEAIRNRAAKLLQEAETECLVVFGSETAFSSAIQSQLEEARRRGVDITIGTINEELKQTVITHLEGIDVFVSGLEWLDREPDDVADGTEIMLIMLVDGSKVLVATQHPATGSGTEAESGVYGEGFGNGIVTVSRRLLKTGFLDNNRSTGTVD